MKKNGYTILVVEDERPLRDALVDKLAADGFEVLSAENGQLGLDIALQDKPDVILLDLLMPKMNGMDTLKFIRAEGDWGKSVPVILLTNLSSADEDRLKDVVKYEPSYYLVKSDNSLQEVLAAIHSVLKK